MAQGRGVGDGGLPVVGVGFGSGPTTSTADGRGNGGGREKPRALLEVQVVPQDLAGEAYTLLRVGRRVLTARFLRLHDACHEVSRRQSAEMVDPGLCLRIFSYLGISADARPARLCCVLHG